VATDVDASDGFDIGETVRVEPGGLSLTVVGLARDAQLSVTPTLYVSYDTYLDAVAARNPDAGEPPTNVLGVRPAPGLDPAELAARVNAASEGLDALTRAAAADRSPGVAQVQQSFQVIFVLYGLVVPLVTGLFFLIVTLQKASALTLLRAIGAPSGRLVGSLVAQVAFVIAAGLLLGVAAYAPISGVRIGGVPLRFETGAVLFWSTLLLVLGVASSLSSARRVWRIDPLAATTGAGVER
jgi:putative ABC transport system permease protein